MRVHHSPPEPLILAHRGASAVAPENTLFAFAHAFRLGADGIELDVRLAADGVPVVIHDATLRRTGLSPGAVSELTSKQLSQVDVGRWFERVTRRRVRQPYPVQYVPSLAEVFQLAKDFSSSHRRRPMIYAELKTDRSGSLTNELVQSVVQLVKDSELRPRVVIISFELKALMLVKEIDSTIRTGALFAPKTKVSVPRRKRSIVSSALDSGANEILLHRILASRRAVELAIHNNLSPVVWTVNHPAWMRRAHTWGIHALITNNPAKLKAATL